MTACFRGDGPAGPATVTAPSAATSTVSIPAVRSQAAAQASRSTAPASVQQAMSSANSALP